MAAADDLLKITPLFNRLSPEDRRKIAEVAVVKRFDRGEVIFEQGSPSDAPYAIASGRVKIFKMMPSGKDVILEVFGPGIRWVPSRSISASRFPPAPPLSKPQPAY